MTTLTQKQDLQCLIRDHMQLLVQSYAIIGHDSSKEDMVVDAKALITELLDPALTSLVVDVPNSIVDVPNLVDNVKSFMDDIPNAIAIHRQKISPGCEAVGLYDSHATGISKQPLVPKEVADLMGRFAPVFKPELYPIQTPNQRQFTNAEDELLAFGLKKFGTNWHEIRAKVLPSKSESEIKNRASASAGQQIIL